MTLTLTNAQKSLLKWHKTHTMATCWKIVRVDATEFYFTDHASKLDVLSNTYTPAGGFDSSARQKQAGLKSRNLELVGILDSAAITEDDLRAGRYRDAEIYEYVVDWRYPWIDPYITNRYWVQDVTFSAQGWTAQLAGFSRWLRPKVGNTYARTCRHVLGDSKCTVILAGLTDTGSVTVVDTQRKSFETNLSPSQPDDYWQYGELTWTSGPNNGLAFEIQRSQNTNDKIFLVLSTPFDITAGETFSVTPGCNKTTDHCKDKEDLNGVKIFDNIANYGGFPFMPGNDRMLRTPQS